MAELSPLASVGWSALALVVACWLTAAFAAPGRLRDRAAWLGATSFYAALLCLFVSLFLRARANDSLAGTLGFGFLVAFFGCGFVLASLHTLRALGGKDGKSVESATN
ncbi:MAG: hypothetical protein ACREI8_07820 [Myxococcota bacterium]